ncbi:MULTISPECIES: GntR family transcriptional regulator [Turicibacter]|jgi:ubiC transcription regulator-associated|uniref:UTRA domain-containing protein n=2 Tax=Turicibacter sanguinis TaxID=154288 RepID=A0A173S020_9FIRM|nr:MULTISPECIES: GntR family transcriptional regulator [Turicibacter]EFF64591.1 UbiC transcription regulator-associated [Turicibacter sanguinis PC909]EGC91058.1 UbiC transcription regulator-associated domain protein [Turicibacter sp. HGF1]MBP3904538.1 GntR family transcriptional regulator [Turicibacter sp.]MCU7190488.1 GntR family transcriptional regulator [Turicibacter sanguinis]MCU7201480.1 GntR family transcriptional regulator [Turicibacter sanguinis]
MSTKYKQIVSELEADLLSGKYNEVKKLPREEDLIEKYQVSRTTIRKAIAMLVNKGYVYQVQGSGIFIREASLQDYVSLENLKGLTRDFPDKKIESKLINLMVINADEDLAKQMKCDVGTDIYFLERLRYVNEEPFAVEYTYLNKNVIPYMSEEIAHRSIYSFIINDLKLSIGFADKIIYADKLDSESAQLLQLSENDPTLVIENTVFLTNGTVFEVSKVIHNYKNTKLLKLANF